MSPRVQLVLYPDGDPIFASQAQINVAIDVPPGCSAFEIVTSIEEHLRSKYPIAAIRIGPAIDPHFDATWHVYRDGYPAVEEVAD